MEIDLIQVPYHLGQPGGPGDGPPRLVEAGACQTIQSQGIPCRLISVQRQSGEKSELVGVLDTNQRLAEAVSASRSEGHFPLILGGDCTVGLGILAGLESASTGIIWFDAHGDYNTPETTLSGYFGGMPLAIIGGLCYPELRTKIGLEIPIPARATLLIGARDLDPGERDNFRLTGVSILPGDQLASSLPAEILLRPLERLREQVESIYLHVDIDVLDPLFAPGVDYRAPGGLSPETLLAAIGMIAERFQVNATALTAYNPEWDDEDRTLQTSLNLVHAISAMMTGK